MERILVEKNKKELKISVKPGSNSLEVYQIIGNHRCFSCAIWTKISKVIEINTSRTSFKAFCKDCGEESFGGLIFRPQNGTITIDFFQNCLHCGELAEIKTSLNILPKPKVLSKDQTLLSEKIIKFYCKCGMYLANIHVKWFRMKK